MQIKATEVQAQELRPGDLFSTAAAGYWVLAAPGMRNVDTGERVLGERCYIRTEAPCPPDQAAEIVYRLEIITEESAAPYVESMVEIIGEIFIAKQEIKAAYAEYESDESGPERLSTYLACPAHARLDALNKQLHGLIDKRFDELVQAELQEASDAGN